MTAGSKAEQPLAKAKPISNCGSTPGETDLREGEKNPVHSHMETGLGICDRNNSADTKDREEGRGGTVPMC